MSGELRRLRARELLNDACEQWGVSPPPGHMVLAPFVEESLPWLAAMTAIEAALSPPEDQAGWRDIADAPKDGTRVLLAEDGGETVYAGAWVAEYESWASYCGQYVTVTPEPTHYMPLPAPPPPQDR